MAMREKVSELGNMFFFFIFSFHYENPYLCIWKLKRHLDYFGIIKIFIFISNDYIIITKGFAQVLPSTCIVSAQP